MVPTSRRQGTQSFWIIILGILAATANADVPQAFFWGFTSLATTLLPECERLQVFVNTSMMPTGPKPPYIITAFEAGGIPTTQTVGSDPHNLWWTVDHAAQSQLAIGMMDSGGNAGGVGPQLYTVLSNPTTGTACHPTNPTSPVTLTTNSTKFLSTCDVLPLKISGGTKPYTVTITPLGAPAAMNFTLDPQFDTLNWVNSVSPGTEIIASVSDAQGIYAPATNVISTAGSNDLTCGNRQSTQVNSTGQSAGTQTSQSSQSSNSSASNSSPSNSSAFHKSNSTTMTVIVAGAVGGAVLIGAIVIGMLFFLRRRKASADRSGRYTGVDNNGFALGGARGPLLDSNDYSSAAEITPFIMTSGQGSPYTDNPQSRMSTGSRMSNMPVGPEMQVRTSSYSVSNLSPGTSTFAMQQNVGRSTITLSPPPSSTVSSFDPRGTYGSGSIASSSLFDKAGTSIVVPLADAAHPPHVGSGAESEARSSEAGPSLALLDAASRAGQGPGGQRQRTPQGSVYQHADILDVVELPPAYRERSDH